MSRDPRKSCDEDAQVYVKLSSKEDDTQGIDVFPISTGAFARNQEGKIGERFKGIKTMGTGAYGTVLAIELRHADDTDDTSMYACKCLNKATLDKAELTQLQQEIELLKRCDHPNIIKFYGYYEDAKQVFLVQELCEGGELFDCITAPKFFERCTKYSRERNAAIVLRQLLSGVSYLHQMGIVHRDMKPENVLLKNRDDITNLKIIDFGLSAKWMSIDANMVEQVGTPYYIAPEVLEKKYGPRCDIWSLGVILYILVCGQAPFWGPDDRTILRKVRERKFSMQGEIWKNASPEVKDLIARMLVYPPANRISAKEALRHPWFTLALTDVGAQVPTSMPETSLLDDQVIGNLRKLHGYNRLQHAIRLCVGFHANKDSDVKMQTNIFKSMDTDGNGVLDRQEFRSAYLKYKSAGGVAAVAGSGGGPEEGPRAAAEVANAVTEEGRPVASAAAALGQAAALPEARESVLDDVYMREADEMFDRIDVNGDGFIGISEWLAVALDDMFMLNRARLRNAFAVFDIDGNGEIDIAEFVNILHPGKHNVEEFKSYVAVFDTDHNGKLSFDEFCKVLESAPQQILQ